MAEAKIDSEDSGCSSIERGSSELKKLKKEQEALKKKVHILENSLRQLADVTSKVIKSASSKGEPPKDIVVLRQQVKTIFQTLQQDTDTTPQEFEFGLFIRPEPNLAEQEVKNTKQQRLSKKSSTSQKDNTSPEEEQKDPENLDDNSNDFFLDSPKSRVFSQEDVDQNEVEKSKPTTKDIDIKNSKSRALSQRVKALEELDDTDHVTNQAALGMEREFAEGDIIEVKRCIFVLKYSRLAIIHEDF